MDMKLRIREYREELGLTQSELAKNIGTLQRNVSNWENGVNEPDCATLLKLAELFEISLDELFGREQTDEAYKLRGIDRQLVNVVLELNETQKYALLNFLRETGD